MFILAAVLSVAVSFLVYRYTVPPVASSKRLLLSMVRGAALTILLFVLCEPLLKVTHTSTLQPVIAVLVDNSLSMTLTDDAGNREETLRSITAGPALRHASSNARLEFFALSPSLHKIEKDSLRLTGTTTDIGSLFAR